MRGVPQSAAALGLHGLLRLSYAAAASGGRVNRFSILPSTHERRRFGKRGVFSGIQRILEFRAAAD